MVGGGGRVCRVGVSLNFTLRKERDKYEACTVVCKPPNKLYHFVNFFMHVNVSESLLFGLFPSFAVNGRIKKIRCFFWKTTENISTVFPRTAEN